MLVELNTVVHFTKSLPDGKSVSIDAYRYCVFNSNLHLGSLPFGFRQYLVGLK